jgi:hypothetical protein
MTEHAPDRLWSGIQISKVIAGTLAAVTAAVLGSFLGVAGTLAGAALASVVGSVGTEIFNNSLKRSTKHLQAVAPTFVKAPAAIGTPEVAAAAEEDNPAHTTPVVPRKPIRWKPVTLGAVAIFIVAMGAIFAVEAVAGESISTMTTGHDSGRNTISSVFGDDAKKSDDKPATVPSTSPSGSSESAESTEPTDDPSATGSTEPTEPATTEPTGEPTTGTPQDTEAPTGSGDQTQQDSGGSGNGDSEQGTSQDGTSQQLEPQQAPAPTE